MCVSLLSNSMLVNWGFLSKSSLFAIRIRYGNSSTEVERHVPQELNMCKSKRDVREDHKHLRSTAPTEDFMGGYAEFLISFFLRPSLIASFVFWQLILFQWPKSIKPGGSACGRQSLAEQACFPMAI